MANGGPLLLSVMPRHQCANKGGRQGQPWGMVCTGHYLSAQKHWDMSLGSLHTCNMLQTSKVFLSGTPAAPRGPARGITCAK